MSTFISWPSISQFTNVFKRRAKPLPRMDVASYRAKVKLHGTNTAVRIDPDGAVFAQRREDDLTPELDAYGFGAWVARNQEFWASRAQAETIGVFGEWAGRGVQKDVALSDLEAPRFFVFAVYKAASDVLVSNPDEIAEILKVDIDVKDGLFEVIPYFSEARDLDFGDFSAIQSFVDGVNADVDAISKLDPLVWDLFGIKGKGEGLVFFPESGGTLEGFRVNAFKAVGSNLRVTKSSTAASTETWATASNQEFVERFVTENRLQQALNIVSGGIADMRYAGALLSWMEIDVRKESADELEASGLEWEPIAKMVKALSVAWLKSKAFSVANRNKAA